jgi:SAM-dependent methyltransferase
MGATKKSDIVRRLREAGKKASAGPAQAAADGLAAATQEAVGYDELDLRVNRLLHRGKMPVPASVLEPEMVEYYKTPARVVYQLIDQLRFGPEDVFFDLGSGLGQVVLLVHLLTGVSACGIEIDPAFCAYARRSAVALDLSGVVFVAADARVADLSRGTAFFMFTPFRGSVMRVVLDRLRELASARVIWIASYGPCSKEIASEGWLKPDGPPDSGDPELGDYRLRVFRS